MTGSGRCHGCYSCSLCVCSRMGAADGITAQPVLRTVATDLAIMNASLVWMTRTGTPPVSGELSGALRAETGRFVQGDTAFRISSTLLWATGGRIGIYAFLPGVVGALPVAGALHCAAPRLAAE